jgi:putative FmdB family regulatory protein
VASLAYGAGRFAGRGGGMLLFSGRSISLAIQRRRHAVLPLYEYKCRKCGHRFERIESFKATITKKCPNCGGVAERMISSPAIQFKGSGWYVTDYAGKNSSKTAGENSESGSSKSGEKTAEKSTESKTSTTETKSEKASDKKKK